MDSTQAPADPMAAFRTLGRLLITGVAAGGVIGGAGGTLALYTPGDRELYWTLGLTFGVVLGIGAGMLLQAVVHIVLLAVRRRSRISRAGQLALTGIAVPLAAAVAWVVGAAVQVPGPRLVAVAAMTALLTLGAVLLCARWCLRPLLGR